MRLLIAAAALSATSSTLAQPPQLQPPPTVSTNPMPVQTDSAGRVCARPNVHLARPDGSAEAKRLGELPPGALVLTVMRNVDGCQELVIASQGIGATLQNERAPRPAPRLRR